MHVTIMARCLQEPEPLVTVATKSIYINNFKEYLEKYIWELVD